MGKYVTGWDLLHMEVPKDNKVWGHFLERGALNGLIGGSDTGKSTLFRNLGISIIRGEKQFLGFDLNIRYQQVLIVSIEDGEHSVGRMFQDFYAEHTDDETMKNLHFLFDYEDSLDKELAEVCKKYKYDVIMIDSLMDVFPGKSANDQAEMRKFLRTFDKIAKENDVAIFFLHHVNKKADEGNVSKKDSLGSSSIEQKMRVLTGLNKDSYASQLRYLTITKGNYVASEHKNVDFVLEFDESTMSFVYQGTREKTGSVKFSDKLKQDVVNYAVNVLNVGTKGGMTYAEASKHITEKWQRNISHGALNKWVRDASEGQVEIKYEKEAKVEKKVAIPPREIFPDDNSDVESKDEGK